MYSRTSQRGFSLIELMIAVTLGLFLTGVMVTVLVNANKNATQDNSMGRMQENARYAMRVIAQDLAMVEFWGGVIDGAIGPGTVSIADATNDCGASGTVWALDFAPALEVLGNATASQATTKFRCISTAEFEVNTDILAIKHVKGAPLTSHDSSTKAIFFRVEGTTGAMKKIVGADTTPADQTDWEYMVHIYYIRKYLDGDSGNTSGAPFLYRKTLQIIGSTLKMSTESGGVAEGIENVIVQFGIDNTGATGSPDGVADYYATRPSDAELLQAVTARIFILARNTQADYSYTNDKVYTLGDVTLPVFNDEYYRRVFSTTIKLRNRINIKKIGN